MELGLVLDCRDPEQLATFWAAALGYTRLGAAGSYVVLVDERGTRPNLLLQRVPEAKTAKNRMHFDIHTPHVDAEVARLEQLGARPLDGPCVEHGTRWMVLADPEGNEFCVCDGGQPASSA